MPDLMAAIQLTLEMVPHAIADSQLTSRVYKRDLAHVRIAADEATDRTAGLEDTNSPWR